MARASIHVLTWYKKNHSELEKNSLNKPTSGAFTLMDLNRDACSGRSPCCRRTPAEGRSRPTRASIPWSPGWAPETSLASLLAGRKCYLGRTLKDWKENSDSKYLHRSGGRPLNTATRLPLSWPHTDSLPLELSRYFSCTEFACCRTNLTLAIPAHKRKQYNLSCSTLFHWICINSSKYPAKWRISYMQIAWTTESEQRRTNSGYKN